MHDTELSGTLDEPRLRLADRRKRVVEIGGHLAEVAVIFGLRRQPERDANLIGLSQRLRQFGAGSRHLRLALVVYLARNIGPGDELSRPVELKLRQRQLGLAFVDGGNPRAQQRDLVIDVLHRMSQVPAPAQCLCFNCVRRGGGGPQVRRRDVD